MINKKRLIALTQQLIRINSENPNSNESEIAGFVKSYLSKLGVVAKIYEFEKNRSNVVACVKGTDARHSLLITPHLDTVPLGKNWKFPPFDGQLHKGRIYGLGATDCKGNVAVSLETIRSLVENNTVLGYNLIFAATGDEESGSELGLLPLLDKGILKPDAAVVLDADDFGVVVAQKGLLHLKVIIKGKKAHGAYPWRGVNAIDKAIDILHELKARKLAYTKNRYLRPPTMNIGTIKGGDKVNIVADWCEFELDFRFLPGMEAKKILKDLKRSIGAHAKKFIIEIEGIQKDYYIDRKHPLVATFSGALKKFNIKPEILGSEGATTITFFQDKHIPAIATGFGIEGCAHTVNEYAKADSLYKGALVLEEFLKSYTFEK
jgi:acetylornithine deacetylase/succinyl-diaminopimelate desuccinylase family protein